MRNCSCYLQESRKINLQQYFLLYVSRLSTLLLNETDSNCHSAIETTTLITSNKGGGKCVCPRSSVCLLARLLKTRAWIWMKYCVSIDVGTWTNRLSFEPDPDYSPDAGTGLLSPLSYKPCYVEFYVRKIRRIRIGRVVLQWFHSVSHRNTFVGGTCAPPRALLVYM